MKRAVVGFCVAAFALSLAGCGFIGDDEREPWRGEVEARCLAAGVVVPSAYVEPYPAIGRGGTCGVDHPFKITATSDGTVSVAPGVVLSCPMVPMVNRWVNEVVQPAALSIFGTTVIEIRDMGSYNCRGRNNKRGARLSEHAFANAIDIGSFRLSDGHVVTVRGAWRRGTPEERQFLHTVFLGGCGLFTTSLGPGAAYHEDHMHFDLARHDPKFERKVCRSDASSFEDVPMSFASPDSEAWPKVLPKDASSAIDAATYDDAYDDH